MYIFQIKWEDRFKGDTGNWTLVTVNNMDFRIQEPRPFSKKWYSHKFKTAGLRYEVAVCINTGHIVWINGPFPCGSWPDINIFRNNLMFKLGPAERVQADSGYRGEPLRISIPVDYTSDRHYDAKSKARARHETMNERLKNWGCLKQLYRHDISHHDAVFRAVAVLTQLDIKYEHSLWDIDYVEDDP